MNDLLDKTNPPPIRLADSYIRWSAVIVSMYLLARLTPRIRNVGKLDLTGIAVGLAIGILWSLSTLIRAYVLAKKGIFVSVYKKNRNKTLFWIGLIIEMAILFAIGYYVLRIAEVYKINFNFWDAIWSLIFSVFFAFFFISGIGYYFLEWRFSKKFFDRSDK
ncbi:MAG: hypothetical protein ABR969_06095 [Sedimentisphaerales bacterium]|jgi:hypothetical protein